MPLNHVAVTIGERIRKWRRWAGLSQGAVAEELEITPAAVSYWETGKACPRERNVERFADLLGISMERFYGAVPRSRELSENRT